ncbi:MAG: GGDEF domain-containing protein, partial [Paracoccaceae bacterium]
MAEASNIEPFGCDHFPVGCLATDRARIIRFANAHVAAQVERPREDLLGLSLDALLTPASRIFCDSYVYPLLLNQSHCDEIALNMATGSGGRASVVVNARVHDADPDLVLWSIMGAEKRDQLQTEVLTARNQLQKQAHALKELASRDELTGLLNRREFKRRKVSMISGTKRSGETVTLFLLDIDR